MCVSSYHGPGTMFRTLRVLGCVVLAIVLAPLSVGWADEGPPYTLKHRLLEPAPQPVGRLGTADGLKLNLDPSLKPSTEGAQSTEGAKKEPEQRQRRVVKNGAYLLYFYQYDPIDDESLLHILGLYWQRDKPDWRLDLLIPFGAYWSWKDKPDRWGLITPLVWHVSDDAETAYTGAWLYHRWRSPTTRFDTLFPIYWHMGNAKNGEDFHLLGPAYWSKGPNDSVGFGLLPLAWGHSSKDSLSWTLLPIAHYHDDPEDSMLLTPLFFSWRSKHETQAKGGIPALLTFWETDDDESSLAQIPLFYTKTNRRTGENSGGLIPLLTFWSNDTHSSSFLQFPLFYRGSNARETLQFITPLMFGYQSEELDIAGLLPFYLSYEDTTSTFKLLAPLLYARYNDPDTDFAMLGPLYSTRDHEEHGFGLWPLFGVTEDLSHAYSSTLLFPIFYANDDANSSTRILAPLLYARHEDRLDDTETVIAGPAFYHREQEAVSYALAPLYWHHDDPIADTEFDLIPGLWYHNHSPEAQTDQWGLLYHDVEREVDTWALLPLAAWRRDFVQETRELFVAPLLYYADGPDMFALALGPMWTSYNRDERSDGVLPLFVRHRWADGSRALWLPGVLDIQDRTAGEEEANWQFTWMLNGMRYENRWTGRETTLVAPLFIESSNAQTGDSFALALPWIYTSANSKRDERFVFALPYYYDRSFGETDWALLPLAFGHEDNEEAFTLVAPLFLNYTNKLEESNLLVGPALFGRYTRGDTSVLDDPKTAMQADLAEDFGWFGPFVWSDNNTSRLRLLAPLLLDWENYEEQSRFMALFPLLFGWQDTDKDVVRTLDAIVPLYVRYAERFPDGRVEALTTIGPLFGYSGEEGSGFGLFPLFWHDRHQRPEGDRGHDILFPLVWHFFDEEQGERTTVVGPLYSAQDKISEHYGIAPLYFGGHNKTPLGGEGYQGLLPLFWYDYDVDPEKLEPQATLITPLGYTNWEGQETSGLWLNYYFDRAPEVGESTDVLFPLVYSHRHALGHSTLVLPLYWESEAPEGFSRVIAPFYAHSTNHVRGTEWTWALPYLNWTERDGTENDMFFPLFAQSKNEARGDLFRLILPGYLQMEDGNKGTRFTALGPIWHSEDTRDASYDTGVFPLLWWGGEAHEEDGYQIGFPLYWRFISEGGRDRLTVLGTGWHHSYPDGHTTGVLPLGFVQNEPERDTYRSMLGPFYYSDVKGAELFASPLYMQHLEPEQGKSLYLGPLFGHGENKQAGTEWTWAGPLLLSNDQEGDSTTLIPFYASRNNHDGSSWRLLAPLYYGSRDADGGRTDTLLGLLWDWDDPETSSHGTVIGPAYHVEDDQGSSTGLFPLANATQNNDGSATRWLLPVAYYDRSGDDRQETLIAGPMFYNRDDDDQRTDYGFAPLLWGYEEPERSGHTVLPLYWYENRDDGHTFASPLAYSNREGENWASWALLYGGWGNGKTSNHLAFPLFYSRRGEGGSGLDLLMPLFARYRSPGQRSGATVLFPLYWNFYDLDDSSKFTLVAPLYLNAEDDTRELTVLPLWFMSRRKDGKRLTHGLVPLYYYSEDPGGYTFNMLGGLVGVDHTKSSKKTDYQLMWIPF